MITRIADPMPYLKNKDNVLERPERWLHVLEKTTKGRFCMKCPIYHIYTTGASCPYIFRIF